MVTCVATCANSANGGPRRGGTGAWVDTLISVTGLLAGAVLRNKENMLSVLVVVIGLCLQNLRRDRYIGLFGIRLRDHPNIQRGRSRLACRFLDGLCLVYNRHPYRKDWGCRDRLFRPEKRDKRFGLEKILKDCLRQSYSCRKVGKQWMDVQCSPWGKSKWPCGSRHGIRLGRRKLLGTGRHTWDWSKLGWDDIPRVACIRDSICCTDHPRSWPGNYRLRDGSKEHSRKQQHMT